jgi:heme-degrading monooxygenase HmoA
MQHVRVGMYLLTGGTAEEVVVRLRSTGGMAEIFEQQPGFVAYAVGSTEDGFLISISIWDSEEQAQAATAMAADWVEEHLQERVELQDDFVGDLRFFVQAGVDTNG